MAVSMYSVDDAASLSTQTLPITMDSNFLFTQADQVQVQIIVDLS